MGLSRVSLGLACVALALGASGCFLESEEEGEAHREGIDVRVGGVDYNVFITRQLNLKAADDQTYYKGREAKPGFTYYGVFLEACNRSDQDDDQPDEPLTTTDRFEIVDTQGNVYEPEEPDPDNDFQYRATELEPGECIPATGSIAQQGPTGGAMLRFELPLSAGENRPLELEITGEQPGQDETGHVELDL